MEKIIYSKFSNERREEFQIRTDIVIEESTEQKKVYKSALYEEGKKHLIHISDVYKKLTEAYGQENLSFCECYVVEDKLEFPYIIGKTLQQMLEEAAGNNDEKLIDTIIMQYIEWMKSDGGNEPFYNTKEFENVFGKQMLPENLVCASVSDIDLIFSNIIVAGNKWNVIDYEWTFEFPIPKNFIIYRALFLAYHQIKRCASLELKRLLGIAGITQEEVKCYEDMEKNFQKYVLNNQIPIRDMIYKLDNKVINMNKVINQTRMITQDTKDNLNILELKYNIDRLEVHSGNLICCGWAYAKDGNGKTYPVDIEVEKKDGTNVANVMNRNLRVDVAEVLQIKEVNPLWGFNIMWSRENDEDYQLILSRGSCEQKHNITDDYISRMEREYSRRYPNKEAMKKHRDKLTKLDDKYYLKTLGYKGLRNIRRQRLNPQDVPYAAWRIFQVPDENEQMRQRTEKFSFEPLISIVVPAYRTPEKFLREMIESVQKQTYENWELCIADGSLDDSIKDILEEYALKDSRVKYKLLDDNYGISGNTNQALNMAAGDYVGLLDHDDILEVDALYEVVKAINETNADVLYTDEDKVSLDLMLYFDPHFKPDYNPDYLKSCNYICHFFVAGKSVIRKVGKFDSSCDGSQDYDFILRCIREATKVYHISKVLYHWRCHPDSTAMNPESKLYCYEAGKRAIELDLKARGIIGATVKLGKNYGSYQVYYPLEREPKVSIITGKSTKKIEGILHNMTYKNYEVVGCEEDEFTPKSLNLAIKKATGEVILLLSQAYGVMEDDWLQILVANALRNEVAAVGPKLIDMNGKVLSAGLVLGLKGTAAGVFVGMENDSNGYFNHAITQQCVSAVSVNGMLFKKSLFEKIGGFNEQLDMPGAGVQICIDMMKQKKNIVFCPYAHIYTCETTDSPHLIQISSDKLSAVDREIIANDPYYNCNYDKNGYEFSLSYK